ncbi:FMRFamide receptor-like [Physella acuta]|uniref:FMRFamide receptor-like n=1 Tax=Physella acuta TaxID=109671 RepID=UPI0027DC339C|nr:FMRFamide receptor-like [Physella acuta]
MASPGTEYQVNAMSLEWNLNHTTTTVKIYNQTIILPTHVYVKTFLFIVRVVLTQVVCVLGVITNLLSIVTFVTQGLRDTVNISLLGLAVSDLFSLLTLLWLNTCYAPSFLSMQLPFLPLDVAYLTGGWPHVFFTRTTTWITVYITIERCVCIAAPMKVKDIFTPKRTQVYILLVYLVMLGSVAPIYYTARFSENFNPARNITLLGITFIQDRNNIETVSFHINNILPLTAFILILTGTAILVTELKRVSKWRLRTSANLKANDLVARDTKVMKMIVFISTIFIFCYLPGTVVFIWMMIDSGLRLDGNNSSSFEMAFATLFFLEALNSSVNICVYLSMSTKFRETFLRIFRCTRKSSSTKPKPNNT